MNYFAFSALINGLTSLTLGIYALIKGLKSPLNRNYSYFAFSVFLWSLGYFFWQIASDTASALYWSRLLMAGAALVPATYFNFILQLTGLYRVKKWEGSLSYLICMAFILLDFTPLFVKDVAARSSFKFWPTPGGLFPFFLLVFFFYAVYGLYLLYLKLKASAGYVKQQSIYVFIGTAIGFIGGSTNYLLWYNIPVAPYANILVAIYPLLLAYAILKHHLMDISIVISRTIAELLTITMLGSFYLGMVWFYMNYIDLKIDILFISMTVIYGILVGLTHQKIRLFLQTTSDKVFLKGKYDYYKELSEISSQIAQSLSVDNILRTLHKAFYEVIEVSNSGIYIEEQLNQPELRAFLAIKEPVFIDKQLLLPCRIEDRLIALITLEPKLSEEAYTDEDLRLLKNIANQTAIALDHHRMYKEMLKAQQQLLLGERQSSMGRVAAELAHEIKNPLAAIKGMTQTMDLNLGDPEFIADFREVVPKEIDRLSSLLDNLLKLSDSNQPKFTRTDVREVIDGILKLFDQKFKDHKITVVRAMPDFPAVTADPDQLTQVFTNLILNAVQAMLNGGELRIKVERVKPGEKEEILVEISDSGRGIPEYKLKEIFEPFFTTKAEGLGLGLAITYKIIKDHGGAIEIESKVGEGTKFRVRLPVSTK